MENEFEYYVMRRKGDQAYPLIKVVDEDSEIMELEFNGTIPRNPVMADFLSGPLDFVRKRIAEVMQSLNMEGVRFIPTKLTFPKGEIVEDYICINVEDNTYVAMDKEKSDFSYRHRSYWINKIVLDREILKDIPLNKRLGFRLREAPGDYLYHKSVVDAILALEPTGVYFENIEEIKF
jgi:hypothetical protein